MVKGAKRWTITKQFTSEMVDDLDDIVMDSPTHKLQPWRAEPKHVDIIRRP